VAQVSDCASDVVSDFDDGFANVHPTVVPYCPGWTAAAG